MTLFKMLQASKSIKQFDFELKHWHQFTPKPIVFYGFVSDIWWCFLVKTYPADLACTFSSSGVEKEERKTREEKNSGVS